MSFGCKATSRNSSGKLKFSSSQPTLTYRAGTEQFVSKLTLRSLARTLGFELWALSYEFTFRTAAHFSSLTALILRTDKLKSVATDAATTLASGVSSLFGSGKMKSLERKNEDLRDEIAIRDETIEQLQSNIKRMEVEHSRAMMNKDNEHRKALEAKEAEHKEETNILNSIINTAHRWYPDFANLLRLERLAKQIGLSAMDFAELIKGKVLNFTGQLFSSEHNRWFATDNTPLQILRDNDRRLTLTANRIPLSQWFCEQYDKLRQSIRQPIQPKKSRGMKL